MIQAGKNMQFRQGRAGHTMVILPLLSLHARTQAHNQVHTHT